MRAALETLLRARKLDVTLTSSDANGHLPAPRRAPTGVDALDVSLGGGLRRGHLSEITGPASTGRTTLALRALAAATARGEAVALVDPSDAFDPASAAAHRVALPQLLWVRVAGDPAHALKAFSLILQAGGFGLVILDLADVAPAMLRRFPATTWMRLARIVEGSDTVALLVGIERIARSAGGVTVALASAAATWHGAAHRARLFKGIVAAPRVVGPSVVRGISGGSGETSAQPLRGEGGGGAEAGRRRAEGGARA